MHVRMGLLLLTVCGAACASGTSPATQGPAPAEAGARQGAAAPELRLPAKAGGEIDLRGLEGKVVLVDFWASWCSPCKDELPVLDAMYREHHDDGLEILAVSIDEDPADADALLTTIPVSFPVLYDADQTAAERWAPPKMPTSYIIGRDGTIVEVREGFTLAEADALKQRVVAQLQ